MNPNVGSDQRRELDICSNFARSSSVHGTHVTFTVYAPIRQHLYLTATVSEHKQNTLELLSG